jgi:glutathione synthase
LQEFSCCLIRKDPPFDEGYKNLCWMLSCQTKVPILNSPQALLTYHEKTLQFRAYFEGVIQKENLIPTCVSSSFEMIKSFCTENQDSFQKGYVCKPWLGHGGQNIAVYKTQTKLFTALKAKLKGNPVLVQPYLEDIHTQGDRRVIVADGKLICHFVRLPPPGKIVSNIAQGGQPLLRKLTAEQKKICLNVAKFLKQKNIFMAGLDMIGSRLGEINITSPTGLRTYETLTGTCVATKIFQLLVKSSL